MSEWKRKEKVIVSAIEALNNLQSSINAEPLAPNDRVVLQLETFVSRLKDVQEEGRTPDDMNLFPLPVPLIENLEKVEENNPELFQFHLLEQSVSSAKEVAKKCQYLEVSEAGMHRRTDIKGISCFN